MERSQTIQVRVTPDEKAKIEKQMRRENFSSMSDYVRKVMLDRIKD